MASTLQYQLANILKCAAQVQLLSLYLIQTHSGKTKTNWHIVCGQLDHVQYVIDK